MVAYKEKRECLMHQDEGHSCLERHTHLPTLFAQHSGQIKSSISWKSVKWLQTITKILILLKVILIAKDIRLAIQSGAVGIIVSNHGAWQLDYVFATINVLEEVITVAQGRPFVFFLMVKFDVAQMY